MVSSPLEGAGGKDASPVFKKDGPSIQNELSANSSAGRPLVARSAGFYMSPLLRVCHSLYFSNAVCEKWFKLSTVVSYSVPYILGIGPEDYSINGQNFQKTVNQTAGKEGTHQFKSRNRHHFGRGNTFGWDKA